MDFKYFLNNYWRIFTSYLCEFHKLEPEFISKYVYEIDWSSLSKNIAIEWNKNLIKKYEDRWLWHELAWNPSIIWTEELIDTFKKRLDWYYLGRNINLPITEEFIQKYLKNIFIVENNKFLTNEIKSKYSEKILPLNIHNTQKLKKLDLKELENILKENKYYHNQEIIYKEYILPNINENGLDDIFEEKFDYSQSYFFLDAIQNDVNGLTPEYVIEKNNPFQEYKEGRGLLHIDHTLKLKYGSLQEGPDRLYEIPRFSGMSYYSTLLVSENVKMVLEKFKISNCRFHPVEIHPKKIKTRTKFFILQLDYDTVNKSLDFEKVKFSYRIKSFKQVGPLMPISVPVTSYEGLMQVKDEIAKNLKDVSTFVEIFPDQFILKDDYDIYSHKGDILVNEYVKQKLEELFPMQMMFQSAQGLRIKINQEVYDYKRKEYATMKVNTNQVYYSQSATDKFYYDKAERLEKEDNVFSSELVGDDEFNSKAKELKVIFPEGFKKFYRKNKSIKGYDFISITDFYIENEYSSRNPETFKTVIVAENGCGDFLGLILEKDSDYSLKNELFEFLHETGEVKKFKKLSSVKK